MYWVYGSFVLIGLIGVWLKNHKKPLYILGGTFVSSILFFAITNFGVWMTPGSMYAPTVGRTGGDVMSWQFHFFRNTVGGECSFLSQSCSVRMKDCSCIKRRNKQSNLWSDEPRSINVLFYNDVGVPSRYQRNGMKREFREIPSRPLVRREKSEADPQL